MKDLFLSQLEQAIEMLQNFGHLTHYMDLPDEVNNNATELYLRLFEVVNRAEDLTPTDIAKYNAFSRWYERLDIAGVYMKEKPICAECLTETGWDNIHIFSYEERISRSDHDEFICDNCGNHRGGRFDPKLKLGSN